LVPLKLDEVRFIVLHHIVANTATWEQINQWHKEKGYDCAGYNEYIRKDGTVYILRGDYIGAHTLNFNSMSYGIACEGDYNVETEMPKLQAESVINRCKYNLLRFKRDCTISLHKNLSNTDCPGNNFPDVSLLKNIYRI
jgi:hypothetical protein